MNYGVFLSDAVGHGDPLFTGSRGACIAFARAYKLAHPDERFNVIVGRYE